jgi:DNA-binding response OmpR family regulator
MAAEAAAPLEAAVAWLGATSESLEALAADLSVRGFQVKPCADLVALFELARAETQKITGRVGLDGAHGAELRPVGVAHGRPDQFVHPERAGDINRLGLELKAAPLIRAIRRSPRRRGIPVLLLSSSASSEEVAEALRAGADDCLGKPIPADVLAERLSAALRTTRQFSRPEPWARHLLKTRDGRLILNLRDYRCQVQEGAEYREIRLTRRQFQVLAALMKHPNRVVRWQELFSKGWQPGKLQAGSRTLVQHVMRLRQLLGQLGRQLETVAGVGYRWID